MSLELTTEEVVTKLLSANEIIKRQKNNFYTNNDMNLGDFLKKIPMNNMETTSETNKNLKYTFITTEWII